MKFSPRLLPWSPPLPVALKVAVTVKTEADVLEDGVTLVSVAPDAPVPNIEKSANVTPTTASAKVTVNVAVPLDPLLVLTPVIVVVMGMSVTAAVAVLVEVVVGPPSTTSVAVSTTRIVLPSSASLTV